MLHAVYPNRRNGKGLEVSENYGDRKGARAGPIVGSFETGGQKPSVLLLKLRGCRLHLRARIIRKRERKTTSLADLALHGNRAAMRLDEALGNSKAEARALVSFCRSGLVKLLKDRFKLVRGNSDTGVSDRDIRERGVTPGGDGDLSTAWSELQSVTREVIENLLEALAICAHDKPRRDVNLKVHGLVSIQLGNSREDLLDDGPRLKLVQLELEASRFDSGIVEDVLDYSQQMLSRCADMAEESLLPIAKRPAAFL